MESLSGVREGLDYIIFCKGFRFFTYLCSDVAVWPCR